MPRHDEIAMLREQITNEVNGDALVIGKQLFSEGRGPDMHKVSDEQMRAEFRARYQKQDRQWLQQEARRDPRQFLKFARDIGVMLPGEGMPVPGQPMPPSPPQTPVAPAPAPGVAPQVPIPDPAAAMQLLQQALAPAPQAAAPPTAAPVGPALLPPQPTMPPEMM